MSEKKDIIGDFIATSYDAIVCPFCGFIVWREKPSWFELFMDRLFKQTCLNCEKKFKL